MITRLGIWRMTFTIEKSKEWESFSTNSLFEIRTQIDYLINNQMHEDVAQSVKLLLLNKLE